jgi:hypothetical protein
MPLGNFINLPKFRKSGTGNYMACCPAHSDRSASLSIKEEPDGRVLFHCFAGCDKEDILAACGMDWQDVMPERAISHGLPAVKNPFSAMQALNHLHMEACFMLQASNILKAGGRISRQDRERLVQTTAKLAEVIGMCR